MTFADDGFGCEFCLPVDGQFARTNGIVIRGENSENKKMTHAEIMHIKTRAVGRDGRVHSHPRWETKDF